MTTALCRQHPCRIKAGHKYALTVSLHLSAVWCLWCFSGCILTGVWKSVSNSYGGTWFTIIHATFVTSPTYRLNGIHVSKHLYSRNVSHTNANTWFSASSNGYVSEVVAKQRITSCRSCCAAVCLISKCNVLNVSLSFVSRRFLQVLKASCSNIRLVHKLLSIYFCIYVR